MQGDEARGGKVDARGGKGHGEGIDAHDQRKKPHALRAHAVYAEGVERDANRAHQQGAAAEDECIDEIPFGPLHRFLLSGNVPLQHSMPHTRVQ